MAQNSKILYPISTPSRLLMDLSGLWDFKLDNGKGFDEKWFSKKLENSITIPVPASYNDLQEGAEFRDHYGFVFYQREVSVPLFALKSQRIVLRMDAVTHSANVYLNGELICTHKGGFLPFEVEITDKVTGGSDLLTIAVDNRIDYTTLPVGSAKGMSSLLMGMGDGKPEKPANHPNFDFFNYCGITRPVKIYTTPKEYISDITVVPSVSGTTATLAYTVDTVGDGKCVVEVRDKDGKKVAESEGKTGKIEIQNANLWWPLKPYLYDIVVSFKDDKYTLPYGIRTVRVEGKKFLINEKPFYFKGYGKHEDTFPNGRGINLPMNTKDISLMKWQGANSFRTSHYPYSEEMMRLCDREGIVVIDETTAVGVNLLFGGGANFASQKVSTFDKEKGVKTFEHHKDVIRDLIGRDKNHACVVMWSIANEPDSTSEGAYEYFKPLFDLAREIDPQKRPCTLVSVMTPSPDKDVTCKLSDVICLNRYYGWYVSTTALDDAEVMLRKELQFWNTIGKPVVFTEYGADTILGFHDTTSVLYTEEYQVEYYEMYSKVFDSTDIVVGEQVWNFADFNTSQGLLRVQGNHKGLFTRDRKPKMAAHYFKQRWTKIPDFEYKK